MNHPWLQNLLDLQKIDLRIRDLETRLTLLPSEMDALVKKRDLLNAKAEAAAAKLKQLELSIKKDESEIQRLTEESQRIQQKSSMVKTNDEYKAMLATIDHNKEVIGSIEERLIEAFDQLDAEKRSVAKVNSEVNADLSAARSELEELIAFAKEVQGEVVKLKEARKSTGFGVDPAVLSRYRTLIASKKGGIPVVPVENGNCGNCHMKITPQTANELRKGTVQSCDNCQHLIYDSVETGVADV